MISRIPVDKKLKKGKLLTIKSFHKQPQSKYTGKTNAALIDLFASSKQIRRNFNNNHLQQLKTLSIIKKNLLKTSICELSSFVSDKAPFLNTKVCPKNINQIKTRNLPMQWQSADKSSLITFKSEFYGKLICLQPKAKVLKKFVISKSQGLYKNKSYNKKILNSYRRNVEYNTMSIVRKQNKIKQDYIKNIKVFGIHLT